jgi:hypothetical protein
MDDQDLTQLAQAATHVTTRRVRAPAQIHIHGAVPGRRRSVFWMAFAAALGVVLALIAVGIGFGLFGWAGTAAAVSEVKEVVTVKMEPSELPGHLRVVAENRSPKRVLDLQVSLVPARRDEATEVVVFPVIEGRTFEARDIELLEAKVWGDAMREARITGGRLEHVRAR